MVANPLLPITFRVHKSLHEPRVIMTETELGDAHAKLKDLDPPDYNVIYALCHTGARKNELRVITCAQVDFATGFITLTHTKNGEDRNITMSESLRALLEGLQTKRLSPDTPKDHVFLNAKNILISPWQVDNALAKLQAQNPGMKPFCCHDLRNSFA